MKEFLRGLPQWIRVLFFDCPKCRKGNFKEYGMSGHAVLRVHLRCENCGNEVSITQD